MKSFKVNGTEVIGPQQLTVNEETVDIRSLTEEKQKKLAADDRKLVIAKVRISSKESVNPLDLNLYLSQFRDWYVRKIRLHRISPLQEHISRTFKGFSYIIEKDFEWDTQRNLERFLKNRTLNDVLKFLNEFPMQPKGIDAVELMTLSNTQETVTIGCEGDCYLTFQGASEESRYQEFIDFWENLTELSIDLCGKIEEEEIIWESIRKRTGRRRVSGWSCFI